MKPITVEKIKELKAICEKGAIRPLKGADGEACYVFKDGKIIDAHPPYEAYDIASKSFKTLTEYA